MSGETEIVARKSYSDKEKFNLIAAYKACGSLRAACAHLNIPYITAKRWKAESDWWPEIEEEVRLSQVNKLSKRFQNLSEKAEAIVAERLENGDHVFDQRTGEIKRIPVSTNMAQTVWRDAIDREMQVTDKLEKRKSTEVDETMQDRLAKLLESFAKFASAKEITVEKEPQNALHA